MPAFRMIASCLPLMFCCSGFASESKKLEPVCGGYFGLCGYEETGNKEPSIPLQYERAFKFSEGLAGVKVRGKFGFINRSGEMVIDPKFDHVGQFKHGIAEVLVGDLVGVIDRFGKFVVRPQFARAIPFTPDTLLIVKGRRKARVKRPSWRFRIRPFSVYWRGLSYSSFYLYNLKSGWISEPLYGARAFDKSGGDLIWAAKKEHDKKLFGLVRSDGTWQVEPRYSYVEPLSEGLAVVRGAIPDLVFHHNGKRIHPSGAVNRHGELVIPLIFDHLKRWEGGYGLAKWKRIYGLVTPEGKLVGGRYFAEVEQPYLGRDARVLERITWLKVGKNGALVPQEKEGRIITKCPGGLTLREVIGKKAQISHPKLNVPLDFFSGRRSLSISCVAPVLVTYKGKTGYVRQDGKLITNPPSYEDATSFSRGVAIVKRNGMWGAIDQEGQFVVEPIYESLNPSNFGWFRAKRSGRKYYLDRDGKELPNSMTERRYVYSDCKNGSRIFRNNGLFGIKVSGGKILIPAKYRAISCFSGGIAWVADDEKRLWCPLGADGQQVDFLECKGSYFPGFGWDSRPKKLHEEFYESSVLWNRWYREYGLGIVDTKPPIEYGTQF